MVTTQAAAGQRRGLARTLKPWFHPATVFAAVLCGMASLGCWAAAERPVAPPDFTGSVAGLAFSPFHRGESPEGNTYPSRAEIESDLAQAAAMTGQIRTYTVQGVLGEIPDIAQKYPLRITLGAWLDRNLTANDAEITRLITVARSHGNVDRVLVGNETVLRRDLTPEQLIGYIRRVKAAVRVPVSTAEPWHVWLDD
ncbi:MAG: glycosyl transferase, partial [Acetobacteraceae bacterium]|nr:glycosyl transferase [Acetobacteraceae bacterium]